PYELEKVGAQLVGCNGGERGMCGNGWTSNLKSNMDDAERHDPHLIRMLTVMGVEEAHENAEQFPNGW
ncbi:hypothetical protein OFL98_29035, partial [Escherichia coli]|nr:hypothetical protein [Escherichia coli]